MRRWWLVLATVAMFGTQLASLRAGWLVNRAVLRLQELWPAQRRLLFEPACGGQGESHEVTPLLLKALDFAPQRYGVLTHLGRGFWLEGRCDAALEQWEAAWTGGDLPAAYELFWAGKYQSLPSTLRAKFARLAYYLAIGSPDQIRQQWYEYAFELYPERHTVEGLAALYVQAGEQERIVALWQNMAERLPEVDPEHWLATARICESNGDWECAAHAYTTGAGLTPEALGIEPAGFDDFRPRACDFWNRAGAAWNRAGEWRQAIAAYEQALRLSRGEIAPYLSIGQIYREQHRYDAALYWCRQAVARQPERVEPYYFIGLTYYQIGNYTLAVDNFQLALQVDPKHRWSGYYLAWTYYRQGNLSEAVRRLEAAVADSINPPAGWWMELGDWRLEQRDCAGAREAYVSAQSAGADEQALHGKLRLLEGLCEP